MLRLALLVAVFALSACTSTRTARPMDPLTQSTLRRHGGDVFTVRLVGGGSESARSLRIEPDSASWFDARTGALRHVPTDEIASVGRVDRQRGAVRGAATAAVTVGAATAVAVFVAQRTSECSPNFFDFCGVGTQAAISVASGAATGFLAAFPGAGIGALVGDRDVLDLSPPRVPPAAVPEER